MRTVQMTLDDELVSAVDNIVKKLKTTRSAFARKALKDAIRQANINILEKKHKKGYERYPVRGERGQPLTLDKMKGFGPNRVAGGV